MIISGGVIIRVAEMENLRHTDEGCCFDSTSWPVLLLLEVELELAGETPATLTARTYSFRSKRAKREASNHEEEEEEPLSSPQKRAQGRKGKTKLEVEVD